MNYKALPQGRLTTSAVLLALSFPLLPFYPFASGAFQPVDIFIVIFTAYIFFSITYDELFKSLQIITPFLPFLCWVILLNSYYVIISAHLASYLLATIQLVYVFVIIAVYQIGFTRIMLHRYGHIYLYCCIMLLAVSPLVLQQLFGTPSTDMQSRQTLSFNNPNQLGYFSILILCMLLAYSSLYKESFLLKNRMVQIACFFTILLGNYFCLISVSRAAIIGIIILDFAIILFLFRRRLIFLTLIICLPLILYGFFDLSEDLPNFFENSFRRFANKTFLDRYDIFHRTIEQVNFSDDTSIVFGSGPRVFDRSGFRAIDFKGDVHYSIVGILSQYGLFGLSLIAIGFVLFAKRVSFSLLNLAIFISIAIYNMSHYGLRFRLLWIALALLASASSSNNITEHPSRSYISIIR